MKKKLYVFDFDGTIISGHTHNAITKAKREAVNPENVDAWETVKNFSIIGSSDDWKNIFETLNQRGHHIVIASFNAYPEIISKFLEEKVELEKDLINKINMKVKFPADPQTATKNEYIQEAIDDAIKESGEKKDFSGDPMDVILIDDSKKNINAANENGYQVIHAKKDASHLTELKKKLAPIVDRNAKPKLSESELLKLKIKTLEKQREALVKQREEHQEHLEQTNIYSNNKVILLNDQKLNELDLADKENYDQLSKVKSQLSKLQSQAHVKDSKLNYKQAVISKKVIEQSSQRTADLSQDEQLKQEIEKFKNLREEHIETILQLSHKENLSAEENSILSLKGDLPGITAAIKVKEEYLGKEKPDAIVVDHDITPKRLETNSENQGAVPKKKPDSVKPEINLVTKLQERSEQIIKDWQKPLPELKKQKELEDLLKAKPKKDKLFEMSSEEKQGAVSAKNPAFLNELNKTLQAKKAKKAMQGPSTFFGLGNLSTSRDNTKTQEEKTKTASKQFSR